METQKVIGRHKYNYLKSLDSLDDKQKQELELYKKFKGFNKEQIEKTQDYFDEIRKPKAIKEFHISKSRLYKSFLRVFNELNGKEYIINEKTIENIKPLALYFSKDEGFKSCKNLVTKLDFGSFVRESTPSFEKGLLIIGGYGNGKTSVMQVFEHLFEMTPLIFRGYTANNLVEDFESCNITEDKKMFWHKMNSKRIYFDDVKTERTANNYGKTNLFKDILEKRYADTKKTYITCNYSDQEPNDLNAALSEFGEKYGGRVFDRLFEMFNIIEFKGNSFRK